MAVQNLTPRSSKTQISQTCSTCLYIHILFNLLLPHGEYNCLEYLFRWATFLANPSKPPAVSWRHQRSVYLGLRNRSWRFVYQPQEGSVSSRFADLVIDFRKRPLAPQLLPQSVIQLPIKHLPELFSVHVHICIKHLEPDEDRRYSNRRLVNRWAHGVKLLQIMLHYGGFYTLIIRCEQCMMRLTRALL